MVRRGPDQGGDRSADSGRLADYGHGRVVEDRGSGWWATWMAFVFGICLSLCANVVAAPE
ncbi:hypothetical protein LV79_002079 [Actinokineospora globicatena]|uniref:hypothetical protein n=1 Tax=Actinokineospora globicatena TaxID=103729 RepID=UPI0024A3ED95|nr:hypothetical protein [Actinokineospora globicatena]MCP2302403.1 hypothetical protein [Actinokineospora globicatena]GLW75921.1 hypothetical protein Aglo01_04030 [Actinokineospora globicatena]GLW82761.1 hypothetical protein Aglo02_04010 [Actinokineospora globicatena]